MCQNENTTDVNAVNGIKKKFVKDLLGENYKFIVPAYQRGYRWDEQQAEDMLNDIKDFAKKNKNNTGQLYYMQPIVVKKENAEKEYTVVDGQQRLTTMLLLLKQLKGKIVKEKLEKQFKKKLDEQLKKELDEQLKKDLEEQFKKMIDKLGTNSKALLKWDKGNFYSIKYKTRKGSESFLNNIEKEIGENKEANKEANPDYWHMTNVYNEIGKWLDKNVKWERKENNILGENFVDALLNQVCFIWYELGEGETETEVFKHLNQYRVPLTKAELIKALFLNETYLAENENTAGNDKKADIEKIKFKLASEWDEIENALQKDEFWLFIHEKQEKSTTRIEYIFDMIAENEKDNEKRLDTFQYFENKFKGMRGANYRELLNKQWDKVKSYFRTFKEWYEDYELYHYIGYLVAEGKQSEIGRYVSEWQKPGMNKREFIEKRKNDIYDVLFGSDDECKKRLYDLQNEKPAYVYDIDKHLKKSECEPILLLHNIETIIQKNKKLVEEARYSIPDFTRFPFHLYKKESWDIEHISANAGDNLSDKAAILKYLVLAKTYINDKKVEKKKSFAKSIAESTDAMWKDFEQLKTTILDYVEQNIGDKKDEKSINAMWKDFEQLKTTILDYVEQNIGDKKDEKSINAMWKDFEQLKTTILEYVKQNNGDKRDNLAKSIDATWKDFEQLKTTILEYVKQNNGDKRDNLAKSIDATWKDFEQLKTTILDCVAQKNNNLVESIDATWKDFEQLKTVFLDYVEQNNEDKTIKKIKEFFNKYEIAVISEREFNNQFNELPNEITSIWSGLPKTENDKNRVKEILKKKKYLEKICDLGDVNGQDSSNNMKQQDLVGMFVMCKKNDNTEYNEEKKQKVQEALDYIDNIQSDKEKENLKEKITKIVKLFEPDNQEETTEGTLTTETAEGKTADDKTAEGKTADDKTADDKIAEDALISVFNDVKNRITDNDAFDEDEKNMLWNFTLLDSHTNREYGNHIFPIKRTYVTYKDRGEKIRYYYYKDKDKKTKMLVELFDEGFSYVPECTMNVFMKYYTKQPMNMMKWTETDAQCYWEDIKSKLNWYIEKSKQQGN